MVKKRKRIRQNVHILQNTVTSELQWYVTQSKSKSGLTRLNKALVHCMRSKDDEWWWKHEARNLDDWLAVVLEEYERAQA